jgi:hypothetical protein
MPGSERVRFTCPNCGKRLRAKASAVGSQRRCPLKGCGRLIEIPDSARPGDETDASEPRPERPQPIDVSIAAMSGIGRWWARLANAGVAEDPNIYGQRLRELRYYLRAFGLRCLGCRSGCSPSLAEIEQGIKQRQSASRDLAFGMGAMIVWQPSWDKGGVCKRCNGVVCGPCTIRSIKLNDFLAARLPHCPRCEGILEGVDHLTD